MDFNEGLPKAAKWEVILVVVDKMSRYMYFIVMKHPYTTKFVAEIFVKEIAKLHGYPRSILSDRDNTLWNEMFQLSGI